MTENPESIVFYLDLTTDILSKKDIVKSIQTFLDEKIKKNPKTSFSIFQFTEGNEPILSDEMTDIKELVHNIGEGWKNREQTQSNFENGLFYCLSFLASKAAISLGSFRVICITDSPSKKGSEYAEALMALVETVRTFPTFIDIIRIGKEDMYPDDVKLRIVSTLTSGGLFYVSNAKEFKITFVGLAKNKTLPDLREEGGQEIEKDKKSYYENISKTLVETEDPTKRCILCSKKSCDYCSDEKDIWKCPQCGNNYHECCAALYSWKFNIGLKHIFRCVECGAITKLEEALVYQINGMIPPGEEEIKEEIVEEVWSPEPETPPVEEKIESVKEVPKQAEENPKQVQVKHGLFGKPIPRKRTPEKVTTEKKEEIEEKSKSLSATEKAASARRNLAHRKRQSTKDGTIRICKVCSSRIKPGARSCPNCGSPSY